MKRAKERGFDKEQPLQDAFFQDASRPGRPPVVTEVTANEVKKVVSATRNTRTLTLVDIARRLKSYANIHISPMSVWRTLRFTGYRKVKPTKKPGLTDAQRAARLKWCLEHQYWTLEDWKKVLWSDETSVIYGLRRGGERVWRTVYENNEATCRRNRWKGFSEFMFWGCFSYDHKGPCHVWQKETAAEKKKAQNDLDRRNALNESNCRTEWELSSAFNRKMNLRGQPKGRTHTWRFTKETGKLVRESTKGGVDWYRYSELILKQKLIPFAQRHSLTVQEDGASPHIIKSVQRYTTWPPSTSSFGLVTHQI